MPPTNKIKSLVHFLSGLPRYSSVENKNTVAEAKGKESFKNVVSVLKAMNEIKEAVFRAPDSHDYCGSATNM